MFGQVHLAHTAIKAEQEESGKLTRAMSVSSTYRGSLYTYAWWRMISDLPVIATESLRRHTELRLLAA